MSSNQTAVSVRGLSKAYTIAHEQEKHITLAETILARLKNPLRKPKTETFWALKDVNFEIQKGEVVGVVGRNGAGKSTLLKVLSRITEPTCGEIDVYGRVGSLLEVGTGFHPELTGRENIYLNGAILGMTKSEINRQFDAIVDFAGVEKFLDTPVKRYSSGMYVRLAFAVAAHLNPEILIIDEVLSVGDASFQKKCIGKMGEIAREGRTVIFVSHDLTSIIKLTTRALLFRQGQLILSGPTHRIVAAYVEQGVEQLELVDLSTGVRSGNLRYAAKLKSVKLGGSDAQSPWKLPFGCKVSLEITMAISQPVENLELGVGLFTSSGFEIASTLSSHTLDKQSFDPGEAVMGIKYDDLTLTPGLYRFGIGLRSEQGMEDYLPEAVSVEIVPSEDAAGAQTDTLGGAIVPQVSYEILQLT